MPSAKLLAVNANIIVNKVNNFFISCLFYVSNYIVLIHQNRIKVSDERTGHQVIPKDNIAV